MAPDRPSGAGQSGRDAGEAGTGERPDAAAVMKRSAVSAAFSVGLPTPPSARCNWNWRRSSALALAGERPRKSVSCFTART